MIDLEFVERLIQALDESSLDNLELERGGTRIRLSKSSTPSMMSAVQPAGNPASPAGSVAPLEAAGGGPAAPPSEAGAAPGVAEEAASGNLIEVTSPMVGTFYRAPAPDAPPYVDVGDRIGQGSVLCIIEAMKLMNELEAEVEGTIAKILVENAEPVEYGQVLFLVDPS